MTDDHGRRFWIAVVIGGAVMAFGIRGVLGESSVSPVTLFSWIVGADLAHDLLVAPLAGACGVLVHRYVREPVRTPVRAGLFVSAVVLVVAWPAWRGYGRDAVRDNLSVQPLEYTTSIATVLGVVWLVVLVWTIVRIRSSRAGAARGASG